MSLAARPANVPPAWVYACCSFQKYLLLYNILDSWCALPATLNACENRNMHAHCDCISNFARCSVWQRFFIFLFYRLLWDFIDIFLCFPFSFLLSFIRRSCYPVCVCEVLRFLFFKQINIMEMLMARWMCIAYAGSANGNKYISLEPRFSVPYATCVISLSLRYAEGPEDYV